MTTRERGGLLRSRDFRLLWTGETTSVLGSSIAVVALPLVAVVTLQASTFAVGLLTAAAWLPWLLIGLPPAPGSTGGRNARSCWCATAFPCWCS